MLRRIFAATFVALFAFVSVWPQGVAGSTALAGAPWRDVGHTQGFGTTSATSTAALLGPKLQAVIDQQRKSINIPGVSAAVIFADGSSWSGASGQAMLSPATAVSGQTPFVLGSITKVYVAALIMRLAEEGLLSIDDPLSRWLPDYPNAPKLRLRQLLSHTSGLYNYFSHPDYGRLVYKRPSYHWTPHEILTRFARPPYFAPGASYRYSNTNYVLLGLVAERAGGAPLDELMASRLWQPLGLERSWLQSAGPAPAAAKGYLLVDGKFKDVNDASGYRPSRSAATVAYGAGDAVGNAADVAALVHGVYGGGLLEPGSVAAMIDWQRYPGGGSYGLGTRTRLLDGRRMYGHTGSLRGFVASAFHLPAEGATVVVMTNRGRIGGYKINDALMRQLVPKDTTPPSVPTGLSATAQSGRYVRLTWAESIDDSGGPIYYRVFRNGVAIGSRTTALTYLDRPSSVGTYKYRVRAIDAAGNKSAKSPAVSVVARR